jgi:SAM-dependent methyltransferase
MANSDDVRTYDPAHFEAVNAVERDHAWFRARRELIGQLAAEAARNAPPEYRALELGCGTGGVLETLVDACSGGRVVGVDLLDEGLAFARQRTRCPLVAADVLHPPFGRVFHLVGLFDVLEHIPDDRRVLGEIANLLVAGGTLLITVPADPSLWSYYDEAAHHVRRYSVPELQAKLRDAGFEIEYISYFMQPLAWMLRTYRRLAPRIRRRENVDSDHRVLPIVNPLFYRLLKREHGSIRARRQIASGSSIVAIVRWPGHRAQ